MTHRRAFIRQLSSVLGAAALGDLVAVDGTLAAAEREFTGSGGVAAQTLRDRYMLDPDVTYFNHASIGTIPRAVHEARIAYLELCETNPWLYMWGDAWEEPREEVRRKAAAYLGCSVDEVAFTHNTTEGFNTLAAGLPLGPGDEVLFSSLNHPGASICWQHYSEQKGYQVRRFDFPIAKVPRMSDDDILDLYDRQISKSTRVLVFPHIDNIVGLRYPVRELAALAHERGVEIVAVDGAQSVGMLELDLAELGVDAYCASPHKWLQAPKGLGLMYVRRVLQGELRPLWVTWGQERWTGSARIFEDYGTRNLPEVVTLGDAIDFQIALGAALKTSRYHELHAAFRARALEAPGVIWRSPESWERSASLFALELEGVPSADVFRKLYSDHGFVFRPFGAEPLNTIRISPNVYNTDAEVDRFFDALAAL